MTDTADLETAESRAKPQAELPVLAERLAAAQTVGAVHAAVASPEAFSSLVMAPGFSALGPAEAQRLLGGLGVAFSLSRQRKLRADGEGPPFSRDGGNGVAYLHHEDPRCSPLRAWTRVHLQTALRSSAA